MLLFPHPAQSAVFPHSLGTRKLRPSWSLFTADTKARSDCLLRFTHPWAPLQGEVSDQPLPTTHKFPRALPCRLPLGRPEAPTP